MKITLETPIEVGDLVQRRTIRELDIVTISFALAATDGKAIVSVTMQDPVSGFQSHQLYRDADLTPQFWQIVEALICPCCQKPWPQHLLERFIADGKLPAGTIS